MLICVLSILSTFSLPHCWWRAHLFRSTYLTPKGNKQSAKTEEKVLNKIVSDYDESGNPGKFFVESEGNGRYAVIGRHVEDDDGRIQDGRAVLDTPISIPLQSRSVREALNEIKDALQEAGTDLVIPDGRAANAPDKDLVGGENVPARVLLSRSLETPGAGVSWVLQNQIAYRPDLTENADGLVDNWSIYFSPYRTQPRAETPGLQECSIRLQIFYLPLSWKGYRIVATEWEGGNPVGPFE